MFLNKKEKKKFSAHHVKSYRRTGALSQKRFSFFSKKRFFRNSKALKKTKTSYHKQDIFLYYSYFTFLFLFFGVVMYMFLFSPYVRITHVQLEGTEDIPVEDIISKTEEYLSGKYTYIFPKRSYPIFYKKSFHQYMLETFPKIRVLEIEKKFPNTLKLFVTERKALMVWCSAESCFMLDEFGQLYEREDEVSYASSLQKVRIIDQSAQNVSLGEKVMEKSLLELFVQFYENFPGVLNLQSQEEFSLKKGLAQEAQVYTREGWYIRFSTEIPADQSLRVLKTFFEKEFTTKEERKKLEYLDIRAENKVFYKLKDELLKEDDEDEEDILKNEDEESEIDEDNE